MKKLSITGFVGGIVAIIVWINLTFINPYNNPTLAGPLPYPTLLLLLPACLAIYASVTRKQLWMFVSFVWSIPMSITMIALPDINPLYGMITLLYFASFLFIRFWKKEGIQC